MIDFSMDQSMKENLKWVQHFKIEGNLSLKEVLTQNLISEEDYLKWACMEYQLPRIRADYFQNHPRLEIWNKFKDTMDWGSTLVPLEEWEDYLYVGCLEPQLRSLNQKVIFVLAPFKKIEDIWNYYSLQKPQVQESQETQSVLSHQVENLKENSQQEESKKTLEIGDDVQPLKINKGHNKSEDSNKTSSQEELKTKDSLKESSSADNILPLKVNRKDTEKSDQNNVEEVQKEAPQKELNENLKINQKEKTEVESEASKQMPRLDGDDFKLDTEPHFFSGVWNKFLEFWIRFFVSKPKKDRAQKKVLEKKKLTKGKKIFQKDQDKKKQVEKKQDEKKKEELSQTKSIETVELQTGEDFSSKEEGSSSVKIDGNHQPKSSVKIAFKKGKLKPLIQFSKDDSKKDIEDSEESKNFVSLSDETQTKVSMGEEPQSPVRSMLEKSKKYVRSYILFRFLKKRFISIKWSHDLQPKKNKPVLMNEASFFRVSYMSKKPYFGFVPPVLGNQNFFENWNFESLPDQIVFIPFTNKDKTKVIGGYLGILGEVDSSLDYLRSIEEVVEPLSVYYHREKGKKKLSA